MRTALSHMTDREFLRVARTLAVRSFEVELVQRMESLLDWQEDMAPIVAEMRERHLNPDSREDVQQFIRQFTQE